MRILFTFATVLLSFTPLLGQGPGFVVLVPSVAGNAGGTGPFSSFTPIRYEEVYGSSTFSLLSTGGGWITQIGFIGEQGIPGGFGNISNIQISLSTTAKGPDGLSTSYAANVGADNAIVYSGGLAMGASPGIPTTISLAHPFFYNPNAGNLLMDVRNYSGMSFLGGMAYFLDIENTQGDTVSSVINSSDANATTGQLSTSGLVTEFIVTPVPEASTFAFAALGGGLFFTARSIQAKTKNRKGKEKWH